jgi:hypothetical protein
MNEKRTITIFISIFKTMPLKKTLFILAFLSCIIFFKSTLSAKETAPDTVKAGIYITSIHDIDFKQRQYNISMWLWLKYKRKEFDFMQNMEIPQAKSFTKSFSTIDTTDTVGHEVYILMKLDCVMQDSWKITNFPFDKQKLRFSIENSQFDSKELVFVIDTLGRHFDPLYTLRGWLIDSINIVTGKKAYETTFGDKSIPVPHTEYSNFKVLLGIDRDAMGLFWKMFLGMYVSFLIAYMCFYIHADNIDSRFGLSVGALFAVIGNKYIIDSSLPESSTFTLVDALHGVTLGFILLIMACNAYSLKLIKTEKIKAASQFDRIAAQVSLVLYLALNIYFIMHAMNS